MKTAKLLVITALATGIAGTGISAPASAAEYFAGKTINVIVGFGPGGIDRTAPFYLPFIAEKIAAVKQIEIEELLQQVYKNSLRTFFPGE